MDACVTTISEIPLFSMVMTSLDFALVICGERFYFKESVFEASHKSHNNPVPGFAFCFPRLHSVVKFTSWALLTNFRCKKGYEGGRNLRQDCLE